MSRRQGSSGPVFAAMVAGACASGAPPTLEEATAAWIDERAMPAGAVTSLDGPKGSGTEPVSIEEYLRGRVPGLQVIEVGGSFTLRLRGGDPSLLGGSPPPLVVIDGMPIAHELMSEVLRTVRPGDIREIKVFRDVASTSVYGMRGAGGVILIRTIGR
jgi:TonB-dependent starch-binding outer membrane protein SusC